MNFEPLKNFLDFMAEKRTPSNAVVVYYKGEKVFSYHAGYSSFENKTPLSGDEFYNIYSCSKITTVVAGMQLLEQGKYLLNDPLYTYIPEYRNMYIKDENGELTKAKNPITIGDLFSMTAGLTYNLDTPAFKKAMELTNGKMDTVTVAKCIAEDPISFEPGTHWQYSLCHDVLAALVEVVSGKKFRDYVKENIFDPLDMNKTVYHTTPEIIEKTAEQYRFVSSNEDELMDLVKAQSHGNSTEGIFKNVGKSISHIFGEEYDSGGAGITTTVADYAKLMAALANFGVGLTGEKILSKYSINLMRHNRLNEQALKDVTWKHLLGYGYGLGVRTHMRPDISGCISNIGEFGWGGAAGATAIVDPDINLGVFYVQHCLNPREEYYQPRLKNTVYGCLE